MIDKFIRLGIAQTCMVVDWGQLCASVDWLDPISKKCRENMGAIRRDCEAAMTAVEKDCRYLVGKAVSGKHIRESGLVRH